MGCKHWALFPRVASWQRFVPGGRCHQGALPEQGVCGHTGRSPHEGLRGVDLERWGVLMRVEREAWFILFGGQRRALWALSAVSRPFWGAAHGGGVEEGGAGLPRRPPSSQGHSAMSSAVGPSVGSSEGCSPAGDTLVLHSHCTCASLQKLLFKMCGCNH